VRGQESQAVSDFVKQVVPDAKERLFIACQYSTSKLKQSQAFHDYFNPQPLEDPFNEDEAASTVKSVLQKMALGLSAKHGIKVLDLAPGKYGYVSTYPGLIWESQGDIHLAKGPILRRNGIVVMTYIHEASHKFAQTKDYDGKGYLNSRTLEYAEPGLTCSGSSMQRIWNGGTSVTTAMASLPSPSLGS
jgi:hypothetical protein